MSNCGIMSEEEYVPVFTKPSTESILAPLGKIGRAHV